MTPKQIKRRRQVYYDYHSVKYDIYYCPSANRAKGYVRKSNWRYRLPILKKMKKPVRLSPDNSYYRHSRLFYSNKTINLLKSKGWDYPLPF